MLSVAGKSKSSVYAGLRLLLLVEKQKGKWMVHAEETIREGAGSLASEHLDVIAANLIQ